MRKITVECEYGPGGDTKPPVNVLVTGPSWAQNFTPTGLSFTSLFQPGVIVRVRGSYSNDSFKGAYGVVMDVNNDPVLVQFGCKLEGMNSTRRFKHATHALTKIDL